MYLSGKQNKITYNKRNCNGMYTISYINNKVQFDEHGSKNYLDTFEHLDHN